MKALWSFTQATRIRHVIFGFLIFESALAAELSNKENFDGNHLRACLKEERKRKRDARNEKQKRERELSV